MFFKPRYLKDARNYVQAARRIQCYRLDLMTRDEYTAIDDRIKALERAASERDEKAVRKAIKELESVVGRIAPQPPHAAWRENCEVILVAVVIAAGVRSYLLEPFKIPTGSMQPTLYGLVGTRTPTSPPNPVVRAFDFFVTGRSHFNTLARDNEEVIGLKERSTLNYFTYTDITTDKNTYTVFAPMAVVTSDFGVKVGRLYEKGDPIVRGYVDNGDFVLVNKLAYNFSKPQRADVFVFKTTDIYLIERGIDPELGSQHYIKRIAGLPGDSLRIDPPNLFINGKIASEKMFGRVMSQKDGYEGYSVGSGSYLASRNATFTVPPRSYFALGDNSQNSSDSRYWGLVPERNVTGKAFMVFWPITSRWGIIK